VTSRTSDREAHDDALTSLARARLEPAPERRRRHGRLPLRGSDRAQHPGEVGVGESVRQLKLKPK
jgi:hypothetical protein